MFPRHSSQWSIFLIGIVPLFLSLVAPVLTAPTAASPDDILSTQRSLNGDGAINRSLASLWITPMAYVHVWGCPAGYDTSSHDRKDLVAMLYDCDEAIGPVDFFLLRSKGKTVIDWFTTSGSYPTNQGKTHKLEFVDEFGKKTSGDGIPGILKPSIPAGYDSAVVWCSYWSRMADDTIWGPSFMSSNGGVVEVTVDSGDSMRCDWFFDQAGYTIIDGSQASMIDLPDTEVSRQVERGPIVPIDSGSQIIVTPAAQIEPELIPDTRVDDEAHPPDPIMPGSLDPEAQTCTDSIRLDDEPSAALIDDCTEPAQGRSQLVRP